MFGLIHIMEILTFELFEGGFNSHKLKDILKRNLKFIRQVWGKNIILVADNWSVHKMAAAKSLTWKIKLDVLSYQVIKQT